MSDTRNETFNDEITSTPTRTETSALQSSGLFSSPLFQHLPLTPQTSHTSYSEEEYDDFPEGGLEGLSPLQQKEELSIRRPLFSKCSDALDMFGDYLTNCHKDDLPQEDIFGFSSSNQPSRFQDFQEFERRLRINLRQEQGRYFDDMRSPQMQKPSVEAMGWILYANYQSLVSTQEELMNINSDEITYAIYKELNVYKRLLWAMQDCVSQWCDYYYRFENVLKKVKLEVIQQEDSKEESEISNVSNTSGLDQLYQAFTQFQENIEDLVDAIENKQDERREQLDSDSPLFRQIEAFDDIVGQYNQLFDDENDVASQLSVSTFG